MFEDQCPAGNTKALSDVRADAAWIGHWKQMLPTVAAHFNLDAASQHAALEAARAEPCRAHTCYQAIVNSLRGR